MNLRYLDIEHEYTLQYITTQSAAAYPAFDHQIAYCEPLILISAKLHHGSITASLVFMRLLAWIYCLPQ
jgi:hypothetical protein